MCSKNVLLYERSDIASQRTFVRVAVVEEVGCDDPVQMHVCVCVNGRCVHVGEW